MDPFVELEEMALNAAQIQVDDEPSIDDVSRWQK